MPDPGCQYDQLIEINLSDVSKGGFRDWAKGEARTHLQDSRPCCPLPLGLGTQQRQVLGHNKTIIRHLVLTNSTAHSAPCAMSRDSTLKGLP